MGVCFDFWLQNRLSVKGGDTSSTSVDSEHRTRLVTGLKFRVHLEEWALERKTKGYLIKNLNGEGANHI